MSFRATKRPITILVGAAVIVGLMTGCAMFKSWFGKREIEAPTIDLVKVEVNKELGWWFYADNIKPTKGEAGNHGAPLSLAFVFSIQNPNKFPILMDHFSFTVKLDNNKLDDINLNERIWIPPQKTNELRVYSFFDVQSARLNVLVEKGLNLKKEKILLWNAMEEYWTGILNSGFPIYAKDGTAVFSSDKITKTVNFDVGLLIEKPNNERDSEVEN